MKQHIKYCKNCKKFTKFTVDTNAHSYCEECSNQMCGLRLDISNQRKKIYKLIQNKHANEWRIFYEEKKGR